eukprot:TRINITY_DN4697_c1_g1_i1.p1 TRINITY_DN4697_c1_g1~~TRINITY_DN4697_c1_g1_i1.p1  ORF type:complete len:1724 (+),score=636.33 TRINITY_DN4697_c1_g1_i1:102-5174(+)
MPRAGWLSAWFGDDRTAGTSGSAARDPTAPRQLDGTPSQAGLAAPETPGEELLAPPPAPVARRQQVVRRRRRTPNRTASGGERHSPSPPPPQRQEWLQRRVDEVRRRVPPGGSPDRRAAKRTQIAEEADLPPLPAKHRSVSPLFGSFDSVSMTASLQQGAGEAAPPQPAQQQATPLQPPLGAAQGGPAPAAAGGAQEQGALASQLTAAQERMAQQSRELEMLRHQLAHARLEARAARDADGAGRTAAASAAAGGPLGEGLSGAGFYKEQLRKARREAAEQRAERDYHESLLRAALERPPQARPPPVQHCASQTLGLDAVDLLVLPEQDSQGSSEEEADASRRSRRPASKNLSDDIVNQIAARMRSVVSSEVTMAVERLRESLFLGGAGGLSSKRDQDKGTPVAEESSASQRVLPRMRTMPLSPEEVFYEMCAAAGDASSMSENLDLQVSNAQCYAQLVDPESPEADIFWSWGTMDDLIGLIEHSDVLVYIFDYVPPREYRSQPLGYLLSMVLRCKRKAEELEFMKRGDIEFQRMQESAADARNTMQPERFEQTVERDDMPGYASWLELTKKIIVFLSQPKHVHCLNPDFVYTEPVTLKKTKYSALQFAVEQQLDDVVLQICDAQERLHDDYWKCSQGHPLHFALEKGRDPQWSKQSMRHMLRAAATVVDDRFGLLVPAKLRLSREQAEQEMQPFYIALMYCTDLPGVMDTLLTLLQKPGRSFKLNLRWTGWQEQYKDSWHLLQWAAFQGVDRIFRNYQHLPDFHVFMLDPRNSATTPLHLACISGAHEVVNILCAEMTGRSAQEEDNALWLRLPSPFHLAAQQGHWRCIAVLLHHAKEKWSWSLTAQENMLFGRSDKSFLGGLPDVSKLKEVAVVRSTESSYKFDFSVYTAALLTYVYRKQKRADLELESQGGHPEQVKQREEAMGVSMELINALNDKHPHRLREFAQNRIRQFFLPWFLFMLLMTFYASSESAYMTQYEYYMQASLKQRMDTLADIGRGDLHSISDLQPWLQQTLNGLGGALANVHAVAVGTARLRQIAMSNKSCEIGPSYFQNDGNGSQLPCYGAASTNQPGYFFLDWLFELLLYDHRDNFQTAHSPIQLRSGRQSLWQTADQTHVASELSPLGFRYEGGGYVMEFNLADEPEDWNRTMSDFTGCPVGNEAAAAQCSGEMRWLQSGARLVVFDITIFNPATDYYSIVQWAFELPAFGGVFSKATYRSVRLLKYHTEWDYFVGAVSLLLVFTVFTWLLLKVWEVKYLLKGHFRATTFRTFPHRLWKAVTKVMARGTNLLDFATITSLMAIFVMSLLIEGEAASIQASFDENLIDFGRVNATQHYHFHLIANEHAFKRSAIGFSLMLIYFKILAIVRLHRDVGPISIAIVQTLFNHRIAYFGIILMICLLALSLAAFFSFGDHVFDFRSLSSALLSLFRIIFGEYWEYTTVRQQNGVYGPLLLLFMILFGSLLLINVLTAIIFDIYRNKNVESESNWETDIVGLQINELLSLLHTVGVDHSRPDRDPGEPNSGGILRFVMRKLPKGELNRKEMSDIIEWNRLHVYNVLAPSVSLFPDDKLEEKSLRTIQENKLTMETAVQGLDDKVSHLSDRSETMEKHLKALMKNVAEVHQRIIPQQGQQGGAQHAQGQHTHTASPTVRHAYGRITGQQSSHHSDRSPGLPPHAMPPIGNLSFGLDSHH